MSDVNAEIVQPFKQFVKVRRAASNTIIAGTHHANAPSPRAPSSRARYSARAPSCGSAPSAVVAAATERPSAVGPAASRDASRNTHATPPPRRRRRRDADTSHTQDSIHLVKKCTKPDRKEFARIASATMIVFLIMGFVGFFVKLVHIPINNILMT